LPIDEPEDTVYFKGSRYRERFYTV
jgi:hypothetical protein